MKKCFKFFAMALCVFGMSSLVACDPEPDPQNNPVDEPTTLLSENFESGVPAGWINKDADGDGYMWEAWETYGFNGSNAVKSSSYDNTFGPLTPDNWLISPAVTVPGNNFHVAWKACAQDASYPEDYYSVYVGTIANGVFTETAEIFNETLSAKGQGSWKDRSASLADYGGQEIAIAFRHHNCTDAFLMIIDNFEISNID